MQDGVVVTKERCRIAAIPTTLNDLQDYSPTASLFICDLSYDCAAEDNISNYSALRGRSAIAELFVKFLGPQS